MVSQQGKKSYSRLLFVFKAANLWPLIHFGKSHISHCGTEDIMRNEENLSCKSKQEPLQVRHPELNANAQENIQRSMAALFEI